MTIAIIYHHEERMCADEWFDMLEQEGYEVVLAPLGLQVGSDAWKARVKSDLEDADAVLLLLTQKAATDEWVAWRAKVAVDAEKCLIPIEVEELQVDPDLHFFKPWGLYQRLSARGTKRDSAYLHLLNILPRPRPRMLNILRDLPRPRPRMFCFISYSRTEREFAIKLALDLRNKGVKVWRDEDDIPAGTWWDRKIQKALNNCTHVLLIATPHSVESRNVSDEVSFALNKGKVIIPLMLEECELPLRVHRAEWVDFRGEYEVGFNALLRDLGVGG